VAFLIWYAIIFIIDLLVAFAWGRCVKAVAENKPLTAALYSAFISASGAITIISYNKDNWLIIPAIIGGSVGTYLSVRKKS
jgi:hypothetical protein